MTLCANKRLDSKAQLLFALRRIITKPKVVAQQINQTIVIEEVPIREKRVGIDQNTSEKELREQNKLHNNEKITQSNNIYSILEEEY